MAQVEQFFQAAQQAWAQAAQVCQPQEYTYTIAGLGLQLRLVGNNLAERLTPALAHVATATFLRPGLTIYAWDSSETGIALPPILFTEALASGQSTAWGYFLHDERFRLFFQPALQTLYVLDLAQGLAIYWVGDAHQLALSDGGAPLLTLLHWWLGQQDYQVVHGAAVGTSAGGALLIGKSGSGKSTTALAALHAGLAYVGDDYCLVASQAKPMVYSLYSSGKLNFADELYFPHFRPARTTLAYAQADKALFFFAKQFAQQVVAALPLKAILLPAIYPSEPSSLCEVSPAQAVLAMAPSTIFQLVGARQQTMQQLSLLARQLPCFRLRLGARREEIPALIADRLANL